MEILSEILSPVGLYFKKLLPIEYYSKFYSTVYTLQKIPNKDFFNCYFRKILFFSKNFQLKQLLYIHWCVKIKEEVHKLA